MLLAAINQLAHARKIVFFIMKKQSLWPKNFKNKSHFSFQIEK